MIGVRFNQVEVCRYQRLIIQSSGALLQRKSSSDEMRPNEAWKERLRFVGGLELEPSSLEQARSRQRRNQDLVLKKLDDGRHLPKFLTFREFWRFENTLFDDFCYLFISQFWFLWTKYFTGLDLTDKFFGKNYFYSLNLLSPLLWESEWVDRAFFSWSSDLI